MKKAFLLLIISSIAWYNTSSAQTVFTVMDSIIFHDGYAGRVDSPGAPVGVIKHRNDLFARKLTTNELASIGTSLQMNVTIKALVTIAKALDCELEDLILKANQL